MVMKYNNQLYQYLLRLMFTGYAIVAVEKSERNIKIAKDAFKWPTDMKTRTMS